MSFQLCDLPHSTQIPAPCNKKIYLGCLLFYFYSTSFTPIGDRRIVSMDGDNVSFLWKDRANGDRIRTSTIPGVEFVKRYLRHVLPRGMRSIRYYGFCHPAAKKKRERIRFHTGLPLLLGPPDDKPKDAPRGVPACPCCDRPMERISSFGPKWLARGPPAPLPPPAIAMIHS
jgi:hypothetical protein